MKSGVMTFYIKSDKQGEFVRRWNHLLTEVQEIPGFVSALLLMSPDNNQALGIGVAHPGTEPTADSLTEALTQAIQPDVAARARSFAPEVRIDGALAAAEYLS